MTYFGCCTHSIWRILLVNPYINTIFKGTKEISVLLIFESCKIIVEVSVVSSIG